MPSSMGSSPPRDLTPFSYVSCIGKQVLYHFSLKLVLFDNLEEIGWGEREEGSSGWRGCMYTYGQFILMCDRNHDNIVK